MSEPIAPLVNDLNRPFWEAAEAGRLVLPWCPATTQFFWPPSPFSPFGAVAPEWRDAPAGGVLKAMAVYRRAFQKAFEPLMPYGVGLLELDAGPRLQVHISDADAATVGRRASLGFASLLPGGPKVPILGGEGTS
jgi:uncharacterized OB-fold protein